MVAPAPYVPESVGVINAYVPTAPADAPAIAVVTCAVDMLLTFAALATLWLAMSVMPKPATVFGLFLMLAQLGGGALIGIFNPPRPPRWHLMQLNQLRKFPPMG